MVAEQIKVVEGTMLSQIGQKAILLIGEYLGKYTADIYQNFYQFKDDGVIIDSVNELLLEVVGVDKTGQLMVDKFGDSYNNL